jgi:hypothetical protein
LNIQSLLHDVELILNIVKGDVTTISQVNLTLT